MNGSAIQRNPSPKIEINTGNAKSPPNVEIMIKPHTVAQSIFISIFATIGFGIGASLIGKQGPDHSGKQWQIVFCGFGGLALASITGEFVCKIWDIIAQK